VKHGEDTVARPTQTNEPFLRGDISAPTPRLSETKVVSHSRPLHLILPFDGDLPEIPHLPYLLHRGDMIPHSNISSLADTYAVEYRKVIGGCVIPSGKHRKLAAGSARDLFCFGDEEEDDWENDIEVYDADIEDDYRDVSEGALTSDEMVATITTMGDSATDSATLMPTPTPMRTTTSIVR
jgi:hypothetical protein